MCWLRSSSGQARMPKEVAAIAEHQSTLSSAPLSNAPLGRPLPYIRDTSITHRVLVQVGNSAFKEDTPIHRDLLLDAIEATFLRDWREAILFAHMAVEAMVTSQIDKGYETALSTSTTPVLPKPAFDLLRKNASRDFKVYLHELPLCVLGRSVLDDKKQLYDAALVLSKTRNTIVHSGKSKPKELMLDLAGASRALHCARQLFAWFGVACPALPDSVEAAIKNARSLG